MNRYFDGILRHRCAYNGYVRLLPKHCTLTGVCCCNKYGNAYIWIMKDVRCHFFYRKHAIISVEYILTYIAYSKSIVCTQCTYTVILN